MSIQLKDRTQWSSMIPTGGVSLLIAIAVVAGCSSPTSGETGGKTAKPESKSIETDLKKDDATPEIATEATDDSKREEESKTVVKTDREWRKQLTKMQYYVTREQGTEPSFKNEFWNNKRKGIYHCVCCGAEVFDSKTKFDSGTGWPSFYQPVDEKSVGTRIDDGWIHTRTEVHCSRCEAHLGHVFDDATDQPTGLRYCINSAALKFKERKKVAIEDRQPSADGKKPSKRKP